MKWRVFPTATILLFMLLGGYQIVWINPDIALGITTKSIMTKQLEDTTYVPLGSLVEYQNYSTFYVPYYAQERGYSCGEASLRMLFAYWGLNVSEEIIGAVANWNSSYGTYNSDLLRAAHFSILSTAIQNSSLHGYPNRKIGFPAFDSYYMTIEDLKRLMDEGIPVLVLTSYDRGAYGHFRVVKGYDDQKNRIIVHDPWFRRTPYAGANTFIDYDTFADLWEYSGRWGMAIVPWKISYTIDGLAPNSVFTLRVNITYFVPPPFNPTEFPASNATLNISVPDGYTLLTNSSIVFDDMFEGGESKVVEIQLRAPAEIRDSDTIILAAYGKIRGSSVSYSYYEDYIGWVEQINLVDHTKPRILNIEYNATFGPFILNVSATFYDDSNVDIYLLYNVMNRNVPYKIRKLVVLDGYAYANITLSSGNIDLELAIRIVDEYGNSIYSRSIVLFVSDEPPYVRFEQHELRITSATDNITLRWDVYDDFEIRFIKIYVDDEVLAYIYKPLEEYNVSLTEGIHSIRIEVVDTAYQTASDTMIIYYDYHPPTISTGLSNGSIVSELTSLEFKVEDNVLIRKTILLIDGKEVAEKNGTIKYVGFLAPGLHVVEIYAEDYVGNISKIRINILSLPIITITILLAITIVIFILRRRKFRSSIFN